MIGAGISAVALTLLGLYFFLKSDDEKENSKDIETKEEILKQLEEEIKGLTKPNKEVSNFYLYYRIMYTMKSLSWKYTIY